MIDDFKKTMKNKMSDKQIEQVVKQLSNKANTPAYPANGNVVSFIFYIETSVAFNDKPYKFSGKAGGISSLGAGVTVGNIYTDDIDKLVTETKSFQLNAAVAYTNILFFNSGSHLLGHYESFSISTVLGIGGGSGHWEKT